MVRDWIAILAIRAAEARKSLARLRGLPAQTIVYAENETTARCRTGGKILADRALSRLLKKSRPRSIDELE